MRYRIIFVAAAAAAAAAAQPQHINELQPASTPSVKRDCSLIGNFTMMVAQWSRTKTWPQVEDTILQRLESTENADAILGLAKAAYVAGIDMEPAAVGAAFFRLCRDELSAPSKEVNI